MHSKLGIVLIKKNVQNLQQSLRNGLEYSIKTQKWDIMIISIWQCTWGPSLHRQKKSLDLSTF